MGFQTDCTTTGEDREAYHGAVAPPIYAASLFTSSTLDEFEEAFVDGGVSRFIYTRGLNPTVRVLERKLILLEHTEDCKFFGSGMAAIAAVVMETTHAGDHVVAARSLYNHTYTLLVEYLPRFGVETTFVDITDMACVETAIRPNTKLLYLESPGNPTMQITDLGSAVALAHAHDLTTAVDNSMATAYNQPPADWGIDYVLHTATKYLGGHSDVVAGAGAGSHERIAPIINRQHADLGRVLGPFEVWLVLRGIAPWGCA